MNNHIDIIELSVYYLLIRKSRRTWFSIKSKYYVKSNYVLIGPYDTCEEAEEMLMYASM